MKARRVFASMDKNSQLVLTANGHIMGERFTNSGPLNLVANYASTGGQTASTVSIVEGVPGRNGTPTELASSANTTVTPSVGEHFYYAKVTQGDGKILWSAPIWVTQSNSSDTVLPTVSASESGTSGSITVSATASDNVGVTLVEFYVDNVLKASSNAAPYSAAIDSTTLSNGTHTLVARAYDAA
ncbi:Ig-like domain-containing protein [Massilia sp. H-1]|nr:Ig-like domain-containing protein [Massilia sp. H-1]